MPDEWGLSAEAVLAELAVDEAEHLHQAGETSAAAEALARARLLVATNELGWRRHGDCVLAMVKSARLTSIRVAGRNAYRAERVRLAGAIGPWLCRHDVEALDNLELAAERWGVARTGLARRALTANPRSQRSWAAPGATIGT